MISVPVIHENQLYIIFSMYNNQFVAPPFGCTSGDQMLLAEHPT